MLYICTPFEKRTGETETPDSGFGGQKQKSSFFSDSKLLITGCAGDRRGDSEISDRCKVNIFNAVKKRFIFFEKSFGNTEIKRLSLHRFRRKQQAKKRLKDERFCLDEKEYLLSLQSAKKYNKEFFEDIEVIKKVRKQPKIQFLE